MEDKLQKDILWHTFDGSTRFRDYAKLLPKVICYYSDKDRLIFQK